MIVGISGKRNVNKSQENTEYSDGNVKASTDNDKVCKQR